LRGFGAGSVRISTSMEESEPDGFEFVAKLRDASHEKIGRYALLEGLMKTLSRGVHLKAVPIATASVVTAHRIRER